MKAEGEIWRDVLFLSGWSEKNWSDKMNAPYTNFSAKSDPGLDLDDEMLLCYNNKKLAASAWPSPGSPIRSVASQHSRYPWRHAEVRG